MRLEDIGICISPIFAPYALKMQELEIAEQRRRNEEAIASAMGIPAEFLFNPYVQRLIGTLDRATRFEVDMRPVSMMRRKVRKTYGL